MASYDEAMSFLSDMFYKEKGKYGTIATACSAHSAILPKINRQTFGKDECVSWMIKGIFKFLPKFTKICSDLRP